MSPSFDMGKEVASQYDLGATRFSRSSKMGTMGRDEVPRQIFGRLLGSPGLTE
jgi:hypothetical protein